MKKIIMTIAAVAIIIGISIYRIPVGGTSQVAGIPVGGAITTPTTDVAYIPVGGASVDYEAYNSTDSGTVTTNSIPVGGA
jgi:hypothetical protein